MAMITAIVLTNNAKGAIHVDKQAMEQRARALQVELGGIIFAFPVDPDDPQSQYAVATLFGGGCVVYPDPLDIEDAAVLVGAIIETVKEEKYPFEYVRDVKFISYDPQANAPNVTMRRLRRDGGFTTIPAKGC